MVAKSKQSFTNRAAISAMRCYYMKRMHYEVLTNLPNFCKRSEKCAGTRKKCQISISRSDIG